jgi:hypothetical protein
MLAHEWRYREHDANEGVADTEEHGRTYRRLTRRFTHLLGHDCNADEFETILKVRN